MRALPYGDEAVLLEPADPTDVLALAAASREWPDVVEVVPAARTVLVQAGAGALDDVRRRAAEFAGSGRHEMPAPGAEIVLDVRYDGADLAAVADELGLDPGEVVRRHVAGRYVVAFCGFAPGFAYLTGLDPALHVRRLSEPRTRVPAGSVAIAGEFTGVYPRSSPGGWRLLGRTEAVLWDLDRILPALLPPGTRVRFREK